MTTEQTIHKIHEFVRRLLGVTLRTRAFQISTGAKVSSAAMRLTEEFRNSLLMKADEQRMKAAALVAEPHYALSDYSELLGPPHGDFGRTEDTVLPEETRRKRYQKSDNPRPLKKIGIRQP
jgi:hypothetical protein